MKDYQLVKYGDHRYYVCRYLKKDGSGRLFVIDKEDLSKVLETEHAWYEVNGYVGYTEMVNKYNTIYYLHNLIMDKPSGGGKGQKYTIDHINRNPHDNRKANLRLVSQSTQNENQNRRARKCVLPDECGISLDDIPKCVYYSGPRSGHGDSFVAEIKKDGERKQWESTSSKKVPLIDKLVEIKKILFDVSKEYPDLMKDKSIIINYTDEQINLIKEFNVIIKLSDYDCVKDNLMKIPEKKTLNVDMDKITEETKKYLTTTNTALKTGRKHTNKLPDDCGITPEMIPKYCYYQPASETRGDAFVIDRHPDLPKGKRQMKTTGSKLVDTMTKFKQLKQMLSDLKKVPNAKNYVGSKSAKVIKPSKKSTKKSIPKKKPTVKLVEV